MPKKKIASIDYYKLYKEVFGSPSGMIVLHDLCNRFHIMSSTKKKTDAPGDMELREGERNVALYILSKVNYDIERYLQERDQYQIEVKYD